MTPASCEGRPDGPQRAGAGQSRADGAGRAEPRVSIPLLGARTFRPQSGSPSQAPHRAGEGVAVPRHRGRPGPAAGPGRRPALGPDARSVPGSERDSSLQAAKYLRTQDLAGRAGLQAQLLPATRQPFGQGVWGGTIWTTNVRNRLLGLRVASEYTVLPPPPGPRPPGRRAGGKEGEPRGQHVPPHAPLGATFPQGHGDTIDVALGRGGGMTPGAPAVAPRLCRPRDESQGWEACGGPSHRTFLWDHTAEGPRVSPGKVSSGTLTMATEPVLQRGSPKGLCTEGTHRRSGRARTGTPDTGHCSGTFTTTRVHWESANACPGLPRTPGRQMSRVPGAKGTCARGAPVARLPRTLAQNSHYH